MTQRRCEMGCPHPESAFGVIGPSRFRAVLEEERDRVIERWSGEDWWKAEARRRSWGKTPTAWDVNNGGCEDFALAVHERVPETLYTWGADAGYGEPLGGGLADHMFLTWRGRHYDAQAIDGVSDPKDLPIARGEPRPKAR